jgi:hypothetical protein
MAVIKQIEYQGVKRSCSEWAAILGISKQLLHIRLKKYPVEIAFNPKKFSRGRGKLISLQVEKENIEKWVPTAQEIVKGLKKRAGDEIAIEKVEGLSEIISEYHDQITKNLFSNDELERLKIVKERKIFNKK